MDLLYTIRPTQPIDMKEPVKEAAYTRQVYISQKKKKQNGKDNRGKVRHIEIQRI